MPQHALAFRLFAARVPAKWMPVGRQGHAPIDEFRARPDSTGMGRALGAIARFIGPVFSVSAPVTRRRPFLRYVNDLSCIWPAPTTCKSPVFFFSRLFQARGSNLHPVRRAFGAPYPPAVGVWMITASPASITVASAPLRRSIVPSRRRA